jgi:hypothetical protein
MMIESLYNDRALFPDDTSVQQGEILHKSRELKLNTIFGKVKLTRTYFHHPPSKTGRFPLDEKLGLEGHYTPALARLVCRAASMSSSFSQGAEDLAIFAGIEVCPRQFGRLADSIDPGLEKALAQITAPLDAAQSEEGIPVLYLECDGTGTPMRKEELKGRKGKQEDGSSKTREAKLGCVFTQTSTTETGKPIRDHESTSYVGTYGDCREIAVLLRQEALRRGVGKAEKVVFIGDGAAWIWKNCQLTFPEAVQILDYYHASEYVVEIAQAVHEGDEQKAKELHERWTADMKQGSPTALILEVYTLLGEHPEWSEKRKTLIRDKIKYLENHRDRTRYGEYQAAGYFIGSGVIEAGCKTVVGKRLKQSGMFWSEQGAQNILGLRCLMLGPHFEEAWEIRRKLLEEERRKARRWLPEAA